REERRAALRPGNGKRVESKNLQAYVFCNVVYCVEDMECAMSNHFALFDTAIGRCGIAWGERGINAVQLPMPSEQKTRARIRQRHGDIAEAAPPADVQAVIARIVELLDGKPDDLADIPLDLDGVPEFD